MTDELETIRMRLSQLCYTAISDEEIWELHQKIARQGDLICRLRRRCRPRTDREVNILEAKLKRQRGVIKRISVRCRAKSAFLRAIDKKFRSYCGQGIYPSSR